MKTFSNCTNAWLASEPENPISHNTLIEKLAYYLAEINATHPFREGNGRTQRAFIQLLGMSIGYYINFTSIAEKQMIDASIESFSGGNDGFVRIFEQALVPI